ncbi:uncharacterized protein LOC143749483 [Siphateles boraxobius]|uniref:uncharacterized protein LOC143749483 n=1 Tax=Siphateles boraxobius TaxID=180520 RepID=UPI004064BFA5
MQHSGNRLRKRSLHCCIHRTWNACESSNLLTWIQALRMAEVQGSPVPVLDLSIRCGQKLLEVSLWREEALCELYLGDEVELTHLKVFIWDSGHGKMTSSNYTTVKTAERKVETVEMQVIGVSEGDGSLTLLCVDFTDFSVPTDLYHGRDFFSQTTSVEIPPCSRFKSFHWSCQSLY